MNGIYSGYSPPMTSTLLALVLASQTLPSHDCIIDAVPVASRSAIGEAVLAKQLRSSGAMDVLKLATDACARANGWSVDQALHANGYSSMRFAADSIAAKLGHPSWSSAAQKAIRLRPEEQLQNLAATGTGNAEFELVLASMIGTDPSIPGAIKESSNESLDLFVLMVKLVAVGELERLKLPKG